jgi:glycosyltransferase involved in cell wall biosynthesis
MRNMVSGKTTIIMRTKDRPLLLPRALESVLNQTDEDWVLSLVNDGGDRAALESQLEGYRGRFGSRLHVSHNPQSLGMEAASNVAIKAVTGKYSVVHDDDDSWHPQFLEKTTEQLEILEPYPSVQGIVSGFVKVDEKIEGDQVIKIKETNISNWRRDLSLWHMCGGNLFPPIAFIYRREVYDKIGYYDESLPVLGDWDFNLRFMQHYDIERIDDLLAFYYYREPKQNDVYSNSVIGGMGRHRFYDLMLRNKFLREDLEAGKPGLGFAINTARDLRQIQRACQGAFSNAEAQHYKKVLEDIQNSSIWRATRPLVRVLDKVKGR